MRFLILILISVSFAKDAFLDSLVAYASHTAPKTKFGVSVRSVKTDSIVYSYNGDEWFTPASTLKLLVTAAALQTMPLDYAPKTLIHLEGIKKNNVFSGIIRLEGRGDPNMSARYYPNALFALNNLTDSLKAKGLDTLRGIFELDTSFFKGPRKPEEWNKKFFDSWYGAEISPLSFNDNCVLIEIRPGAKEGDLAQITVNPDVGYVKVKNDVKTKRKRSRYKYALDPIKPEISLSGTISSNVSLSTILLPVRNPAAYFKTAFFKSLKNSGIVYVEEKAVYRGKAIDSIIFAGPTLKSLLDEINQRSQNLHAETLLRNLGQYSQQEGSAASGILSEKLFLHNAEISPTDFKLMDGSGLSHKNSLKPNALTKLLTYMKRQKKGEIYYASLAIPGVSGSGKRVNIEYRNNVRFKTGFIDGVHGLAGYIAADSDTLAFAIYLNNAEKIKEDLARDILDSLVGRIAKFHNSEAEQIAAGKVLWQSGYPAKTTNERINYFSMLLKGKHYFLGPMGEGRSIYPSYKPRVNFSEMDCVTYIEHVLALAYSKTYDDFFDILQSIRYKNGIIDYKMRNHFFIADWVANNELRVEGEWKIEENDQWAISNTASKYGIEVEYKIFEKEIGKKNFFKDSSITNPEINIMYLPKEKAIAYSDTVAFAKDTIFGVAILSELPGIDAAHTGFVVGSRAKKGLMLRHASQLKGKVIEQPLAEFLKTTKIKTSGIAFFRFKNEER
jgi:D-alanyl-D-alanine carboxypeptidase/D-alanyl-D-alanine-endopeptidase (penicillin-binding protein 4)